MSFGCHDHNNHTESTPLYEIVFRFKLGTRYFPDDRAEQENLFLPSGTVFAKSIMCIWNFTG